MTRNDNNITDGCTDRGYIKADPGLHGSLLFHFRPMLPEEQAALAKHLQTQEPKRGTQLQAEAMVRKLVDWDNTIDGVEVPITVDTVRRLRPMLFSRLYLTISGVRPSDPIPGERSETDEKTGEVTLDDILGDRTENEAQQKN